MKAFRVFIENQPEEWHVTDGKWNGEVFAKCSSEQKAKLFAMADKLAEALKALHSCHRTFSSNDNWTIIDDEIRNYAEKILDEYDGIK